VPELLDDGQTLHHSALPAQVQPLRPKAGVEEGVRWPLGHDDVEAWMERVPWRFARTAPTNPHEYSLRRRQDERAFFLVLLHIRERGYQQWYDGRVYTAYDVGEYFLWSMQDPVPTTILINRKFRDPEKRARLAEEKTGKSREELGLEIEPTEHREVGASRAVQPTLTDAIAGTGLA